VRQKFPAAIAVALAVVLFASVLTAWIQARWPVSLLQTGAFLLLIAYVASSPKPLMFQPMMSPIAVILAWGAIQLALGQTVYSWDTGNALLLWGTNLALFTLSFQIFADPRLRFYFLLALLFFAFAVSLICSIGFAAFDFSTFINRNQFAAFIEMTIPLAILGALHDPQRRMGYAGVAAAMYAAVIGSASRSGFALTTIELIIVFLLALRRRTIEWRQIAVASAVTLTFVALFTTVVGWDVLLKRLERPDPFEVRQDLVESTVAMVRAKPLAGFGLGTWATVYPQYAHFDNGQYANYAHNDWLQFTAEGGLPVLAALIWFTWLLARPAIRSTWGIGLLMVLIHAAMDFPLQKPVLAGLFFVLSGILASYE
jgi:O-antigen ligase